MAVFTSPIFKHVTVCLLLHILTSAAGSMDTSNQYIVLNDCEDNETDLYTITGAVVRSQREGDETYAGIDKTCTIVFQAPLSHMKFLVQVDYVDLSRDRSGCLDQLSIGGMDSPSGPVIMWYLMEQCDRVNIYDDPWSKFYSNTPYLGLQWVRRTSQLPLERTPDPRGFLITLTVLTQLPISCSSSEIRCANDDCISRHLLCDLVKHCYDGEDENDCRPNLLTPAGATTASPGPPNHPHPPKDPPEATTFDPLLLPTTGTDVYLWMPLVVVILFTVVMVALIIIAKRGAAEDERRQREAEENNNIRTNEQNGLRINVNGTTNIEMEPGMPATPPPSYSVIERQTSYVSQISQTSDQVSIPPDYDEAVELPGRRSSRQGRRVSRSSTGSRLGSLRSRMQNRLFSRSVSATEQRGRYRSQQSTSSTDAGDRGQDSTFSRSLSVTDDVFESPPEPTAPNGDPGLPTESSTPYFTMNDASTSSSSATTSSSAPSTQSSSIGPEPLISSSFTDDPQGVTLLSDIMELNAESREGSMPSLAATEGGDGEESSQNRSSDALLLSQMTVSVDIEAEPGSQADHSPSSGCRL